MPHAAAADVAVSVSSESSIQRELRRESFMDIGTVALSYCAMFVYIAAAFSRAPPPGRRRSCLARTVTTRAGLALAGVVLVFLSVLSALGVCAILGISATLISMEVIPFLTLAIGVDNMFLLVVLEAEQPPDVDIGQRVAAALQAAGPSITLASLSEVLAFAAAACTPVPAVHSFAVTAGMAVLIDFVLQVTAFVALLALDIERMRDGHADCFPCLQVSTQLSPTSVDFRVGSSNDASSDGDGTQGEDIAPDSPAVRTPSLLADAMEALHRHAVAPALGKLLILASCTVAVLLSLSAALRLSVGLDQAVALPKDSYLQTYFACVSLPASLLAAHASAVARFLAAARLGSQAFPRA